MAISVIAATPRDEQGVQLARAAAQTSGMTRTTASGELLQVRIALPPADAYETMAQALAEQDDDWNEHVELERPPG